MASQIQREHVLDWLIGNHDGHSANFLRTEDGRVIGIDKGQLFKFLGQDKLDLNYHPNEVHNQSEPYYHSLMRAVRDGKVKGFDPSKSLTAIRQVEKIGDDEYLELLRPYAERRFAGNPTGLQQFNAAALARKKGIRRDFEEYYGKLLGKKGFRRKKQQSFEPGFSTFWKGLTAKFIRHRLISPPSTKRSRSFKKLRKGRYTMHLASLVRVPGRCGK